MSEQRPAALGIQTPAELGAGQGGFLGGQNPLQAFDTLAQIQQRNIANQTNMRILQARQNLGEIWATSPPDQLYNNLSRSPDIAFFPEMATLARQADLASTQINRERDTMTRDASSAWGKSLTGLYMDQYPTQERYNSLTQATADTMADPVAKSNFLKHSVDIGTSLLAGLPSEEAMRNNPQLAQQANALVRQRILGHIAGTVGTWDAITGAILGGPVHVIGDRPMQQPFAAPGQLTQMGTPLVPGGPLGPTAVSPTGVGVPGTTAVAPVTTTPTPGATTPTAEKPWGDLTGQSLDKPLPPNPVTGEVKFQPAVQKRVEDRLQQFGDATHGDTADYRNSQRTIMNADYIRDVFDQLQRTGGFLTAGPTLPERVQLLRGWNTIRGALGLPGTDIPQEASFTDLQKLQVQQGFAALNQVFGMGREAEMTVQAGLRSVPGVENTFLSGQLVNRTIEAFAQRAMKRFEFMDDFQSKNFGSLNGAEEAFNRLYPANTLAQQVMSEFGLGKNGFTGATRAETIDNIGKALSKGYLTPLEATNLKRGLPADYKATQTPQPGGGIEIPMPGQPESAPGAAVR